MLLKIGKAAMALGVLFLAYFLLSVFYNQSFPLLFGNKVNVKIIRFERYITSRKKVLYNPVYQFDYNGGTVIKKGGIGYKDDEKSYYLNSEQCMYYYKTFDLVDCKQSIFILLLTLFMGLMAFIFSLVIGYMLVKGLDSI